MPYENGQYISADARRQRGQKGGFSELAASVKVRPLSQWPGARTSNRKHATFSAPWHRSCGMLADELRRVKATNAVIQVEIEERHFRNDGLPRADAPTSGPGVVLSFTHPTAGALMYPCDRYTEWRDNLHALALSLEALRAVDRYGVTKNAEQYRGWKALPAGAAPYEPIDRTDAIVVICMYAGIPSEQAASLKGDALASAIRAALRKSHPDHGGNSTAFNDVQRARKALES